MILLLFLCSLVSPVLAESCGEVPYLNPRAIERLDWKEGMDLHTFTVRDQPIVLQGVPAIRNWPLGEKWDSSFIIQHLPGPLLRVKRKRLDGDPMYHFPTMQPLGRVAEVQDTYQCHFTWHNMSTRNFLRHAMPGFDAVRVAEEPREQPSASLPGLHATDEPAEEVDIDDGRFGSARPMKYEASLDRGGPMARLLLAEPLIPRAAGEKKESWVAYAWMAQAMSVTPCHMDHTQNFYLQLVGRKHFLLFPHAASRQLYLHPATHPAHRSAQVALDGIHPEQIRQRFPHAHDIPAFEAILSPGDVLYLPPLWFHHVTNLEFTLSVNYWSDYGPSDQCERAKAEPLPFLSSFEQTFGECTQVLRVYLLLALGNLEAGRNEEFDRTLKDIKTAAAKAFVRAVLLERRFRHMPLLLAQPPPSDKPQPLPPKAARMATAAAARRGKAPELSATEISGTWTNNNMAEDALLMPSSENWPRFCHNGTELNSALRDGFAKRLLSSTLQSVQFHLNQAVQAAGEARGETYLADWVEWAAVNFVGPRYLHQFLWDLVHC